MRYIIYGDIMNKTKFLYVFAPIMISMFCACVTPQQTKKTPYEKNERIVGSFDKISPNLSRDFDIKELIFVTVSSKGLLDQSVVEDALLRKAKEIGGDDIINVRISKHEKGIHTAMEEWPYTAYDITENVEYHGSALVIKYRNPAPAVVHVPTVPARRKAAAAQ